MEPKGRIHIPLRTVFNVLGLTMQLIEHGVGVNAWRVQVRPGFLPPNHPLRSEGTFPPSKPKGIHIGDENSLWHNFHMVVMLPAIKKLREATKTEALKSISIEAEQVQNYVGHYDAIHAHVAQYSEWKEVLHHIQDYLPDDPDNLVEPYKSMLTDEVERGTNHLVGRVLQAYYATKTVDYTRFGFPPDTEHYFTGGSKTLFDRTLHYAIENVPRCPVQETGERKITAAQAIDFYVWLGNPAVVEMVTPKFLGAASAAGDRLSNLLDFIHLETGGQIDLRDAEISERVATKLRGNQALLKRIDMMEGFFRDCPQMATMKLDITPIRDFRERVWGINPHM